MKWTITRVIALALMAMLMFPVTTPAKGKPDQAGKPAAATKAKGDKAAEKTERAASKEARQQTKAERKSAKSAAKAERKSAAGAALEDSASVDASGSVEATPSVSNAFTRITTNLEKSLAKIAAGKKTQLPPGLVRVWMKFASWLGVDPTTMPGTISVTPDPPTGETTQTAEPTGTVTPDLSQPPTPTVDGSEVTAP